MKIAILHNINRGNSPNEREFDDPSTIEAIQRALATRYDAKPIECHRDVVQWIRELVDFDPAIIFSVAEGYHSAAREAFYPALYEQLGIPYCGSDPTTLLITHNKALTKKIVQQVGVKTPWSFAVSSREELLFYKDMALPFPLLVKPNSEGSSIGLDQKAIVHTFKELEARVSFVWEDLHNVALVEQYIAHYMDVSMTFLEGLTPSGIFGPLQYAHTQSDLFDYSAKNRSYATSILAYPELPTEITEILYKSTQIAVKALDVRGYGRADFRIDPQGNCYFLEMNAQGEIRPSRSDLMGPVLKAGYSYEAAVLHIVEHALLHPSRRASMAGLLPKGYILGNIG